MRGIFIVLGRLRCPECGWHGRLFRALFNLGSYRPEPTCPQCGHDLLIVFTKDGKWRLL